jgi:hypothetical protein
MIAPEVTANDNLSNERSAFHTSVRFPHRGTRTIDIGLVLVVKIS